MFVYGQKGAADQMRTTLEKTVHHVGTTHGQDISNELLNRRTVTIPEPVHTQEVLDKHAENVNRNMTQHTRIKEARLVHKTALEALVTAGTDTTAPLQLALLNNEMDDAECKLSTGLPIKLNDMEKTHYDNEWKTHRERKSRLDTQRGKAHSMI